MATAQPSTPSHAKLLSSSAKRWTTFDEIGGVAFAAINNIAQRISTSGTLSTADKLSKLQQLRASAQTLNRIVVHSKPRAHACTALSTFVAQNPDFDPSHLREQHDIVMQQAVDAGPDAAAPSPDLQQLDALIQRLTAPADSDPDIQQADDLAPQRTRCPFSGGHLVNPVKNTQCNHVYSLQGLLDQVRQTGGHLLPAPSDSLDQIPPNWAHTCAVVACQQVVKRQCLRKDYQMQLTQRQMQSQSHPRASVDVDELD